MRFDIITQSAERYWLANKADCFKNEASLRPPILALVKVIKDSIALCDDCSAEEHLNMLRWAAPRCQVEPLRIAYELGHMLTACYMARAAACLGRRQAAYRTCVEVINTLRRGDERRHCLGMQRRPNSEIRYLLLMVLSLCKWEGPDYELKKLFIPDEIYDEYCRVSARVVSYTDKHPANDPERDAAMMEALLISGLEVLKLAHRVYHDDMPNKVNALVDLLNERHHAQLEYDPWHWKTVRHERRPLWYWDYEIAKVHNVRGWNHRDLTRCCESRMEVSQVGLCQARPMVLTYKYWLRQQEMMLRDITYPLEILDVRQPANQ